MPKDFITKKGLEKLRTELAELKNKRRPEVAERLRVSLAFGDIAENPEYAEAKDEQAFVEGRIAEIENILRNTELINNETRVRSELTAAIGCTVELETGTQPRKFALVGKGEGDPSRGEISSDSPLGRAIVGKKVGDVVRVYTPSGSKRYRVVRIA